LSTQDTQRLEINIVPEDPDRILEEIREGLLKEPREISPRFFYDDAGSHLFEEITRLPEYYQTRTENRILEEIASDLVKRSGARDLIELGSGASTKTRVLLDAMKEAGSLERYIPFDVSEGIVRRVAGELLEEYPGLSVHAVIANFTHHLEGIPRGDHQLCIFLGGTIGNFTPRDAARFLSEVGDGLEPGDHFLLGTDLIKNIGVIESAYNDSRGITARFNKNALLALNEMLDGDFDPDGFDHHAPYNVEDHRIEMRLRSRHDQTVSLPDIDLELLIREGEEILTEISTKFDREMVTGMLDKAGFDVVEFYTDSRDLFALTLARKR